MKFATTHNMQCIMQPMTSLKRKNHFWVNSATGLVLLPNSATKGFEFITLWFQPVAIAPKAYSILICLPCQNNGQTSIPSIFHHLSWTKWWWPLIPSNPHLWSWALSSDWKNEIAEMSFLRRNGMRSLVIWSTATAPFHQKEPAEMPSGCLPLEVF